jgi:hypothetical protein
MSTFTLAHVVLSLLGIGSGLVAIFGLVASRRLEKWNLLFLVTTIATSLTGFLFPFHEFMPSHVIGIVSLVALAIAVVARYPRHLAGPWRRAYAVSATVALYFNVFVLVAQMFQKIPALKAMAPTQSEAPFLVSQVVVMALFVVLGVFAVRGGGRDNSIRDAEAFG